MKDYKSLFMLRCEYRDHNVRQACAVLVPNPRLPEAALRIACACADLALTLLDSCEDSRELVRSLDALRDTKDAGCTATLKVYAQLDGGPA